MKWGLVCPFKLKVNWKTDHYTSSFSAIGVKWDSHNAFKYADKSVPQVICLFRGLRGKSLKMSLVI